MSALQTPVSSVSFRQTDHYGVHYSLILMTNYSNSFDSPYERLAYSLILSKRVETVKRLSLVKSKMIPKLTVCTKAVDSLFHCMGSEVCTNTDVGF